MNEIAEFAAMKTELAQVREDLGKAVVALSKALPKAEALDALEEMLDSGLRIHEIWRSAKTKRWNVWLRQTGIVTARGVDASLHGAIMDACRKAKGE